MGVASVYAGKGMAPQVGLEPTHLRLTAGCSAIELLRSVGKRPKGGAPGGTQPRCRFPYLINQLGPWVKGACSSRQRLPGVESRSREMPKSARRRGVEGANRGTHTRVTPVTGRRRGRD